MKTLVTFSCALFLFALPGFAQRTADLQLQIGTPAASAITVAPMEPISLSVLVGNAGPDAMETTDTIAYYTLIDGDTVPVGIPGQNHFNHTGNLIVPGDSATLTRTIHFDQTFEGFTIELCVFVRPKNANDPITDPDLSDNRDCITITIDDAAGTGEQAAGAVAVAPNPASEQFVVTTQYPLRSVGVTDAAGKTVRMPAQSATVDCSTWEPGTYFLTIETEAGVVVKRVAVH